MEATAFWSRRVTADFSLAKKDLAFAAASLPHSSTVLLVQPLPLAGG